jgi:hypothetical protein
VKILTENPPLIQSDESLLQEIINFLYQHTVTDAQLAMLSLILYGGHPPSEHEIIQKIGRNFTQHPEKKLRHDLNQLLIQKTAFLLLDQTYHSNIGSIHQHFDKLINILHQIIEKCDPNSPNAQFFRDLIDRIDILFNTIADHLKEYFGLKAKEIRKNHLQLIREKNLVPLYECVMARAQNIPWDPTVFLHQIKEYLYDETLPLPKSFLPKQIQPPPPPKIVHQNGKFGSNFAKKKFNKPKIHTPRPPIVVIAGDPYHFQKKRGRPRKTPAPMSNLQNNEPKRGRGRPKKVVDPTSAPIASDQPKRGRGRPKKVVDPTSAPIVSDQPKRGRGRPKKVVDPTSAPIVSDQPKRGRGRPKKVVDPTSAPIANEQPKRGRGRPKKVVDLPINPVIE